MKIIEKSLLENYNAIAINKYINAYCNSINIGTINKILKWHRTAFPHNKDIYWLNKLGKVQGWSNINIDESMFTHSNGNKIWVVGAVNNETRNIRCDIFYTRNTADMKLFINNHIKKENNIITDGWSAYNFLDNNNSHYYHEVHVHGPNGQFWFGQHRKSHIEDVWRLLKR